MSKDLSNLLRKRRDTAYSEQRYTVALHMARVIQSPHIEDDYMFCLILYNLCSYSEACHFLEREKRCASIACRVLLMRCYLALKKTDSAIELSEKQNIYPVDDPILKTQGMVSRLSELYFLRGEAFLQKADIQTAKESYLKSLSLDMLNYKAVNRLVEYSMLTQHDEKELLFRLKSQESDELRSLFSIMLKHSLPEQVMRLRNSGQTILEAFLHLHTVCGFGTSMIVKKHYGEYLLKMDFKKEAEIEFCDLVMEYPLEQLLIPYIRTLTLNKNILKLRELSLNQFSEKLALYCAASLFQAQNKMQDAQEYYHKCTQVDPLFLNGWIGYIESSLNTNNPELTTALLFLQQITPNSFASFFYNGKHAFFQKNMHLSLSFFQKASELNFNPRIVLEQANVLVHLLKYEEALVKLQFALNLSQHHYNLWSEIKFLMAKCYYFLHNTEMAKGMLESCSCNQKFELMALIN